MSRFLCLLEALTFFLQYDFHLLPPQEASTVGASVHLLLISVAMALHLLILDALGTAFHSGAKIHMDITRAASGNVMQELMMAPLLSPTPVDPEKAKEALKTAPQVVKNVI